jgi:DNA-binding NarL/FixJ family response regulator
VIQRRARRIDLSCMATDPLSAHLGATERLVALRFAGNRLVGRDVVETAMPPRALSPRGLQVLQLLAEGMTNSEIAARIYVAPETVKKHVAAVLNALGAENRAHAVAIAFRRGLLASGCA